MLALSVEQDNARIILAFMSHPALSKDHMEVILKVDVHVLAIPAFSLN